MTTPMPTFEASIFADGEGNAWFERNRERILAFDPASDMPLRMLRIYDAKPRRALAIGASNGARLAALRDEFGCEVVGTDLSSAAVADGRERYGVDLREQAAEALDIEGTFDLVTLQFVLCWVSREGLDEAVRRADAALEPGGLLLIGDFYPERPKDVPYHHRTDVQLYTHKRNYSKPFVALGHYQRIGFLSGSHSELEPRAGVQTDERVGLWLLEKKRNA